MSNQYNLVFDMGGWGATKITLAIGGYGYAFTGGGGSSETAATIKTKYESNADTNAFTDAEQTKLAGIAAGAEVNRTLEQLQDIIAAMFQAGTHTNASVTYDDTAGTLSISASGGGGGLDQEQVEDIVGALNVAGTGINAVYDDVSGTLTISLSGESYTTAEKSKLAGIAAGATANTGALANKDTVATADIDNNAVTTAKLEQYPAYGILFRGVSTAGQPSIIAMGTDTVIRRNGSGDIGAGKLSTNHLNDAAVTNAKLGNMAQFTVKLRKTAGTGVPEDGTMTDVVALLDSHFGSTDWRSTGTGSSITVGSGAPTTAPAAPGLFYFDTNLYDLYFSTGTATTSDWRKVIDNTDGASLGVKTTPVLTDTVFQFDSANGDAPVIATWSQVITALALVTLDASGRLVNPKSVYTSFDGGTPAAASTYTPTSVNGNVQHITNNAAFTLAPPANPNSFMIEIVNGATAGAITTTGFTRVSGDAFTTVNGHKFIASITKTNSVSHLNVKAMQ